VRIVGISRSSVYRRPVEVSEKDHTIMAMIDRQYLARPFYGSRRMAAWLARPGYPVGRKRVQRLMRLVAIYQRPNTGNAAAHKIYPYLLGGLTIDRVNRCARSHLRPDGQRLPISGGDYGLAQPGRCRATIKHEN
jgi:putative transposase